ncbi:MAG: type III secretion system export apparatus subunit SctU [Thermodesulforhabdaceae bacterium]
MSGEKTEQPTAKRLRDARKKGQVAKSKEISSATNVIGVFLFFWIFHDHYLTGFENMIIRTGQMIVEPFDIALPILVYDIAELALKMIIPLFLVVIVLDIASNFLQVGFLLSFESVKPSLDKLNPAQALKKIFSKRNLMEFVKSIVKVGCLVIVLTGLLKSILPALVSSPYGNPLFVMDILRAILKPFVVYVSLTFIVLAAADYFFQKRQHIKELMMTKEEVKQEYKEMEGDPHIKSKRRQLHQELLTNNMLQSVKKATVVVTNPTHRAVALFYEKGKTKLPVVVAKGENILAQRILEIARDEGIPIMTDVTLAHDLYEKCEINEYIPSDLIEPVVEVLKWVYSLKSKEMP